MSDPTFDAWWQPFGTMGIRLNVTRTTTSPDVDLTTIDAAQIRIWTSANVVVGSFAASILANPSPTTTTISVRWIPGGELSPGQHYAAALLSADGGVTYYPTKRVPIEVKAPAS